MLNLIIKEPNKDVREYLLDDRDYLLGRSKTNHIVLSDDHVSREHAKIVFDPDSEKFSIEDLNSSTGVYINGKRIVEKTLLEKGYGIRIGSTVIEIDKDELSEAKTRIMDPEMISRFLAGNDEDSQVLPERDDKTRILDPDERNRFDTDQSIANDHIFFETDSYEISTPASYHKFVIVSKADFGKEYLLDQMNISIGRSSDNYIQLNDHLLSSSHATIRIEDDHCFIKDLKSMNGTLVNEIPITGEVMLKKGDEIKIGSIILKFISKDMVFSKDDLKLKVQIKEQQTKTKKLIKILLPVCAVLILFIIIQSFKSLDEKQKRVPESNTEMKIEPISTENTGKDIKTVAEKKIDKKQLDEKILEIYFNTANEFFENRLWEQAVNKYNEVLLLNPEYPGVKERISKAETEISNQTIMRKGLALVSSRKYTKGISVLRQVPEKSVYHNEVLIEIQAAIDAAKRFKLRKKKPEMNIAAIEKEGSVLINKALQYYLNGNIRLAANKLNEAEKLNLQSDHSLKIKAKELKEKILLIAELYNKGLKEYKRKATKEAFQIWAELLRLDEKLVGQKSSYFSSSIAICIADEFYRKAIDAYDRAEFVNAHGYSAKALKAKPKHKGALEIERLLSERAKQLYEEGYILEDLNPEKALEKWKEIVRTCPPDSEYYSKAQSRIANY